MPITLPLPVALDDICAGLARPGQKTLPAWYLYDDLGSALFEAITHLPEYGLTRADLRLLQELAPALPDLLPGCRTVVELGSGSGRKTRLVLESLLMGDSGAADRPGGVPHAFPSALRPPPSATSGHLPIPPQPAAPLTSGAVRYAPIEISTAALDHCRRELLDLDGLVFDGQPLPYLDGLRRALRHRDGAVLVLFLGSSVGNLAAEETAPFLAAIRALLQPGDALLLGADLQQNPALLRAAYADPLGVTAAFNLNLLARLNRDFQAAIDLAAFAHEARVLANPRRVEMHLCSRRAQRIALPAAGLELAFAAGESIHTETCRKFRADEILELAAQTGFDGQRQWIDDVWPFAESLLLAR